MRIPNLNLPGLLAEKIDADLHVGKMRQRKMLSLVLHDTVTFTDHPFADFSSLPIVFILKFLKENLKTGEYAY